MQGDLVRTGLAPGRAQRSREADQKAFEAEQKIEKANLEADKKINKILLMKLFKTKININNAILTIYLIELRAMNVYILYFMLNIHFIVIITFTSISHKFKISACGLSRYFEIYILTFVSF